MRIRMLLVTMMLMVMIPMAGTQAHAEVIPQPRLHDTEGGQSEKNDPSFNPSRHSKRSVLDSLLELGLRHEDEQTEDEDGEEDHAPKNKDKGGKDEISHNEKNDEKEKNGIENKDEIGEPFPEDAEAISIIEDGLGVLKEVRPALHTLLTQLQGDEGTADLSNTNSTPAKDRQKPPLVDFLDGLRTNAWEHFRDMTEGYLSLLDAEYAAQGLQDRLPLSLIRSVLQAGDTANLLRVFSGKLDPSLLEFLKERVRPMMSSVSVAGRNVTSIAVDFEGNYVSQLMGFLKEKVGPVLFSLTEDGRSITSLGSIFGLNPKVMGFLKEGLEPLLFSLTEAGREISSLGDTLRISVIRMARAAVHHFIEHVLWVTQHTVTKDELLKYRDDLRLKVPLAAAGLDILLGNSSTTPEARSHGGYGGGGYGGYGSYDGYGYGGHGGYGVYLDPYLLLAGIGAAALLAYLAYRVFIATTTMAGAGRRRRDDHLDNTDLPEALKGVEWTLNNDYYFRGDFGRSLGITDDLDDLAEALNALWRQRQDDPRCVSCWVTRYAARSQSSSRPPLAPLLVSVMAHLIGAPRSGQLMDEVTVQALEGRPVTCPRQAYTCDLQ
ncbi:uncharacterized protein LOC126983704 [Eriocheir sinensis]|uniref:uncharacterized protein LOC126983704 n=1 Tax=Eriocheir sinensis TaxID=95602 RepID=UPI0021C75916|nr:uncharacterized protein LOC126983704 [Eriocheir sinensis]XP_050692712.1 uncharacterized protein LOC126983704 [Eriocheir sinensis]